MAELTQNLVDHVALVNKLRQQHGLNPLRISQILTDAAHEKATVIAEQDHFSHVEPNGRQHWQLAKDHGYPTTYVGENILYGVGDAQKAYNLWVNSSGHRENMLNPGYTEIGVALGIEPERNYEGDVYLAGVQLLGRGTTEEAKFTEGVDPEGTKKPQMGPRPTKPRVPRFPPPLHKEETLGEKIASRVQERLRRRKS